MAANDEAGGISAELSYKPPMTNIEAKLKVDFPFGANQKKTGFRFAKWRTKRIAKHDGKRNEPPTDCGDGFLTEREESIDKVCNDRIDAALHWFADRKQIALDAFSELMPPRIQSDSVMKRMATLIKGKLDDVSAELRDRRSAFIEKETHLLQFRRDHSLTKRSAKIPDTIARPIAILFATFMLEGIVNGLLFRETSPQGFVGGLIIAFSLSLFNVASGLAFGFLGLRNAIHRDQIRKNLGRFLSGLFFALGLFVNFFVAHFRDSAEHALIEMKAAGTSANFDISRIPLSGVVSDIFPNPFDLETLQSLVLLGLGIIVFALSSYEGWSGFTDRYPEYGQYWRERRNAKKAFRSTVQDNRSEIRQTFRIWRAEIAESKQRYDAALILSNRVLSFATQSQEAASASINKTIREAGSHLKVYRDVNAKIRRKLSRKKRAQAVTQAPPHYAFEYQKPSPQLSCNEVYEQKRIVDKRIEENLHEMEVIEAFLEQLSFELEEYLQQLESQEDSDAEHIKRTVESEEEANFSTTSPTYKWPEKLKKMLG